MRRFQWIILTRAADGRVKEFEEWYDKQHIPDVKAIPGIASAVRYKVLRNAALGSEAPSWDSVAIYDIEADDPQVVIDAITKAARTPAMPISETLSPVVVQLLASQVKER